MLSIQLERVTLGRVQRLLSACASSELVGQVGRPALQLRCRSLHLLTDGSHLRRTSRSLSRHRHHYPYYYYYYYYYYFYYYYCYHY